jgi:hypothetical protein
MHDKAFRKDTREGLVYCGGIPNFVMESELLAEKEALQ